MKYKVSGTIELNFQMMVHADSEDEADQRGRDLACDGVGLSSPVGEPEVNEIELLNEVS